LWIDSEKLARMSAKGRHGGLWLGGVAVLLVALSPVMWSTAIAASGREPAPATVYLPVIKGWHRVSTPIAHPWQARYQGADHYLQARFADDNNPDRVVELAIAYFAYQEEGREVVGYGQGAVSPDSRWAWTDKQPAPANGTAFRMTAPGPVIREVVTFYQLGSLTTGNPLEIKLATLRARLIGGSQRAMAVVITAEQRGSESARPAIDAFIAAMGPIDNVVDQVVAGGVVTGRVAKGSIR
jgi:EpsI family protein